MIQVTKLNMQQLTINADFIEVIETTPDTIITMTTGRKIVVSESREVIIDRIMAYKKQAITPVER